MLPMLRTTTRRLAQALSASVLTCTAWTSQVPLPIAEGLDAKEQAAVAGRIGQMLDERYVFPDVAKKCAAHLLELSKDGGLGYVTEPEAFAEKLTEELRRVGKDKHLLVRVRAKPAAAEVKSASAPHPLAGKRDRIKRDREQSFGFEKVQRLEGNVGYLDLRFFASPGGAFDTAVAAMALLSNNDAIIVDLRENSGGHPGMVQFLCSHFFDKPTHLNTLYFREGDSTQEFWTHGVPGVAMPDVPLFVLTSAKTFSAAEEFAYNLRTQKRATLVGETTRGGANPGGLFPIDDQFEMVIPTGRAINPITGTNWEGIGVAPHVEAPQNRALTIALDLARPAAEAYREERASRWAAVEALHAEALHLDGEGNVETASTALVQALTRGHEWGFFSEPDINSIGHALLGQERRALALAAFTFNTTTFPDSARAKEELEKAQAPQPPEKPEKPEPLQKDNK